MQRRRKHWGTGGKSPPPKVLCSLSVPPKISSSVLIISRVGRCLILGGPNFFSDIYNIHNVLFACVKHTIKNFEVKISKKIVGKMAGMWIKKSIFTVKIPLMAPTLGGLGPP